MKPPNLAKQVYAFACLFYVAVSISQSAIAATVSSPIIVGTSTSFPAIDPNGIKLDGSLSLLPPTANGTPRWIGSYIKSSSPGLVHVVTSGSVGNPFNTILSAKPTCVRNSSNYCISNSNTSSSGPAFIGFNNKDVVELWMMGIYQPNPTDGKLLAFIHEERVANSGGPGNAGTTRIGLAQSIDNGNSWTYLGRIIAPSSDPHNIQGAPYLISGNYFYVYFDDSSGVVGVARALISDVISAAANGTVTNSSGHNVWWKLTNGTFSVPALNNTVPDAAAPREIVHTQATQSSNGNYYLLTTKMTAPPASSTFIHLSQSAITAGNTWIGNTWVSTPIGNQTPMSSTNPGGTANGYIANESYSSQTHAGSFNGGYQYCSIVDTAGTSPGTATVGLQFYVYCQKDVSTSPTKFKAALYRWEINLDPTQQLNFSRQSTDFQTITGGQPWAYQYGGTGPLYNMTWNSAGYWNGVEPTTIINQDSMHPGVAHIPVLKWTAKKNGTVLIEGTVRKSDISCGNGITAIIEYSGSNKNVFSTKIAFNDNVGISHQIMQPVLAGQALFFIVSPTQPNNNFCDSTMWDPSITYQ